MLAYQSEEVIKRVARQIERHTDRTVSSAKELMSDLKRIRQVGYSMNRGEWRESVRGVAVPIMDGSAKVIAAVGVFGPAERLTAKKLDQLASKVMATGALISGAMGYRN